MASPLLMGVLNITPDSFYDGGRHLGEEAVAHAKRMVEEGADIIDVGAESSRPGSQRISVEEEIKRLEPFFSQKPSMKVSIDTMKGAVARYAVEHGAAIVNDISALRFDPKGMLKVLNDHPSTLVVLMHMKGTPENMQTNPTYSDVIGEICSFFEGRIRFAEENGVKSERVILDPGIGFGKRLQDNLEILARVEEFKRAFSLPVLIGASRKSMIGALLDNAPAQERLEGTLAAHLFAAERGVDYLRVHDVGATRKALRVQNALLEVVRLRSAQAGARS